MVYELVLVFIIGLSIGSFLNVLVLRLKDLRSVLNSRSHCPNCKHKLAWFDLIPLVSFLMLKTKCRYCQKPISWQYPMVELMTAVVFTLLFLIFGLTLSLVFYALVFAILIVILVEDFKTQLVPEEFVWAALALSFLGSWFFGGLGFSNTLLAGVIAGGVFAAMVVISKERWMGSGDIKIGIILGLLLGYPRVILGLFLAFVLGAAVGLIIIGFKRKTIKDSLPFAPFLITSILLSLLIGDYVLQWYLGVLIT